MPPSATVDFPVLWHEGMLLTPQHFQQHDIYWQQLLRHQMEQLQPFYWGVLQLTYSAARLDEGVLQIDCLRAVLPDGLVVEHGLGEGHDDDAARLSVDLTVDPTIKSKGLARIYLYVPVHAEGSASERAIIRRFDSFVGPTTVDANTGEDPCAILRLRPRLGLFAGAAPPPNCVAIPLLEVKREPLGPFVLSNYHPPLLQLGASRFLDRHSLQKVLEELVTNVRRKALRLAALKSNRSQNLFALMAALPQLEVLVQAERAHPFDIYKALINLVGHASALTREGFPPTVSRYQHENILPQFAEAIAYLDRLLTDLQLEFDLREFAPNGNDCFSLYLDRDWDGKELVIELLPNEPQSVRHFDEWLREARIGSESLHEILTQQRSPGAWCEPVEPPHHAKYTHRAEAQLFVLKNRAVQLHDRTVPVMASGEPLIIRGAGRHPPPARVVCYWVQRVEDGKENRG